MATSTGRTGPNQRSETKVSSEINRVFGHRSTEDQMREAFCELLERSAVETLRSEQPYAHFFREVKVVADEERLILTGRVPSFYLKSVLQNRLSQVFPSIQIDNRVMVVNVQGISSVNDGDACE